MIGYFCAWLTWTCAEIGLFAEGIGYGEKAKRIAELFPSDQYLFFVSLSGLCYIYCMKGYTNKGLEGAKCLLEYGEKNANSRSKVLGYFVNAGANNATGDMVTAQKNGILSIEAALDPVYPQL